MSKTLKTRPLHVRMVDSKDQKVDFTEYHDHRNGKECDLPAKEDTVHGEKPNTTCFYSFRYIGTNVCSCGMCSDRDGRYAAARKNRHESKKVLKAARKNESVVEDYVFPEKYVE